MKSPCSVALLESALAGNLPADAEGSLHRHLDECEECGVEGGHPTCRRVQEVAEHDQAARLRARDQNRQSAQVRRGRAAWHGDPARAKRRCLAQVNVGDEERRFTRPVWSARSGSICTCSPPSVVSTLPSACAAKARAPGPSSNGSGVAWRGMCCVSLTPRIRERSNAVPALRGTWGRRTLDRTILADPRATRCHASLPT